MRGLRITPRLLLPEALVHFMNLLPSHPSEISDTTSSSISSSEVKTIVESETTNNISGADILSEQMFEFNEILYLKAKNEIDINSYSASVRHNLIQQLKNRIIQRLDRKKKHSKIEKSDPKRQGLRKEMKSEEEEGIKSSVVTVVDLGAGLLNMLPYTQKVFFFHFRDVENNLLPFRSFRQLDHSGKIHQIHPRSLVGSCRTHQTHTGLLCNCMHFRQPVLLQDSRERIQEYQIAGIRLSGGPKIGSDVVSPVADENTAMRATAKLIFVFAAQSPMFEPLQDEHEFVLRPC